MWVCNREGNPHPITLTLWSQTPNWGTKFCCLKATQSVLFCASSQNALRHTSSSYQLLVHFQQGDHTSSEVISLSLWVTKVHIRRPEYEPRNECNLFWVSQWQIYLQCNLWLWKFFCGYSQFNGAKIWVEFSLRSQYLLHNRLRIQVSHIHPDWENSTTLTLTINRVLDCLHGKIGGACDEKSSQRYPIHWPAKWLIFPLKDCFELRIKDAKKHANILFGRS